MTTYAAWSPITHDGKTLTQEPYLDYVNVRVGDTVEVIDGDVYRAHAVDADENEYTVYWTKLADGPDGLDVDEWDTFTVLPA